MKRCVVGFFALIIGLFVFQPPLQAEACRLWKERWQKQGWLLSSSRKKALLQKAQTSARPKPQEEHRSLITKYGVLRGEIERLRRCFRRRAQALPKGPQRKALQKALLREIEQTLREILEQAFLPLWLGTPWHFYGTAEAPHQASLACGYFVVQSFLAAGFPLPQSRLIRRKTRRFRIYSYAMLPASHMIEVIAPPPLRTWARSLRGLQIPLRRHGPGIYVLGLSNHVGLVLYDGTSAHFWHSDYVAGWVKREDLFQSKAAQASTVWLLGKFQPTFFHAWLQNRPILVPKRLDPLAKK